ncbi:MmyB family transcriptional regulator [Actinacidiphila glaucinigra]|uniref:MmyB family transcriptional regulator n=1 Tax=Actinacidiphila glaucinigra TaxID=235986 RepID=UPI003673579F
MQNGFYDILAVNALVAALSPDYARGVNLLRASFLDPSGRELRRDWGKMTQESVASLGTPVGPDVDNPPLTELVGELAVRIAVGAIDPVIPSSRLCPPPQPSSSASSWPTGRAQGLSIERCNPGGVS